MSDSNRQLMKGHLLDLREKHEKTRKQAINLCKQIMPMINPALDEVCDMDIASAAVAMDNLVMHQAELLSLKSKIAKLEEALYG